MMKRIRNRKNKLSKNVIANEIPEEPEKVEAWWNVSKKKEDKDLEDELVNINIKFHTTQAQYAIRPAPIGIREDASSQVLNKILHESLEKTNDALPDFEFLIDNKLLTTTLGQHLTDSGLSFENYTDIEYFERYPPPTPQDNLQHDDWVSSVDLSSNWLLTGSYDKTIQIWHIEAAENKAGSKQGHKLTIPAHKAPVKSVAWIESSHRKRYFVSASVDQTCVVWQWDTENNKVEGIWECRGHEESVECLSVSHNNPNVFATGSWDNTVKIWNINMDLDTEQTELPVKRLKRSKEQRLVGPTTTFAGHTESVSDVKWYDAYKLITCSWDHSIRLWDTVVGGMVSQICSNVAFNAISHSHLNNTLIAGCADRQIRMYDPRSTEGSIAKNKFVGHSKWITSLRWSPYNENIFVSGSIDHTVKLWDRRSSKCTLYDLLGHTDKVMCVDWSKEHLVASGSADCTAQVFKMS